MALNAVMERDSENPTPTLDKEPKFQKLFFIFTIYCNYSFLGFILLVLSQNLHDLIASGNKIGHCFTVKWLMA